MNFAGFTMKYKGLFSVFLLFLMLGMISFVIADTLNNKYRIARDHLLNQTEKKDPSNHEIKKMAKTLQSINEKFHTSESIEIYVKKDGIQDIQYFDLELKYAEYLFPINTVKEETLITEGFQVTEGFDTGKYYIVHRYFPDWFYLFPISLFSLSGVFFILWLVFQTKSVYTTRMIKLN